MTVLVCPAETMEHVQTWLIVLTVLAWTALLILLVILKYYYVHLTLVRITPHVLKMEMGLLVSVL